MHCLAHTPGEDSILFFPKWILYLLLKTSLQQIISVDMESLQSAMLISGLECNVPELAVGLVKELGMLTVLVFLLGRAMLAGRTSERRCSSAKRLWLVRCGGGKMISDTQWSVRDSGCGRSRTLAPRRAFLAKVGTQHRRQGKGGGMQQRQASGVLCRCAAWRCPSGIPERGPACQLRSSS